jgi:hypothetical protein
VDDGQLTISIDRASLALPALVLLGHGTTPGLAVEGYTEPALRPRVAYAADSDWVDGSMPLSMSWQESLIGFSVFPDEAASEAQARLWVAELVQALGRLRYLVTITVNDAPAETWTCAPGTVTPSGARSLMNMRDHDQVWEVSIPCQPIRSIA